MLVDGFQRFAAVLFGRLLVWICEVLYLGQINAALFKHRGVGLCWHAVCSLHDTLLFLRVILEGFGIDWNCQLGTE